MLTIEAIEVLENKLAAGEIKSEFAGSLVRQYRSRGLSDKQLHWVHKLADEAVAPKPAAVTIANFQAITQLFETAAQNLKYPKIVFADAAGGIVRLAVAGSRAKFPGSVNVCNGGRYGDRDAKWFGRIHADGRFEAGRDATPAIVEVLQQFAADPAGYAANYGRTTGNCCFCNKSLTDNRSTTVGYGPVCAKNYGLAWGTKAPKAAPTFKMDDYDYEHDIMQAELANEAPGFTPEWAFDAREAARV